MTQQSGSFKESYEVLRGIAESLRSQQEPDIDALIPMVDKATEAYKICRSRIDAVKTAFAEKLPHDPNA